MKQFTSLRSVGLAGLLCLCLVGEVLAGASAKEKRLIRALSDPSFKVRLQAAIVIGKHKLKGASAALREALDDKHDAVRAAAIVSLAKIGDEDSRSLFAEMLADESRLISRASEKALVILDKNLGSPPVYLLVIDRPRLPSGVPKSRSFRLHRTFKVKLGAAQGILLAVGEEKALKGKTMAAHLKARGLTGLQLQPKLSKLSAQVEDDRTTIDCKVDMLIFTLAERRMEFSAGGEANAWIEDTALPEDQRIDLENEVMKASADAVVAQVLEYLASRTKY